MSTCKVIIDISFSKSAQNTKARGGHPRAFDLLKVVRSLSVSFSYTVTESAGTLVLMQLQAHGQQQKRLTEAEFSPLEQDEVNLPFPCQYNRVIPGCSRASRNTG